jgi:HK97 family phage major capsid protein
VLTRALNTSTTGAASGDTGGFGIATTLMAQSFVDILRNRATIMQLGTVMGGLQGNIDIPKQVAAAQGYWVGEDGDATESNLDLGQISLSPKTVAAYSEITRKLMVQSSLDVEALVRADLAKALALTIDKAGYYGTGTDAQPLGIANHTGINAVNFAAVQPTFAELVEMETQVALDNADVASMAYVGNAAFRGHAKTTLKFPGVNGSATIWEPGNTVNGYRAEVTNQIETGDVFMGNFSDLLVAMWGGLELLVDPYSNSKKGRLRVVVFQDVDFALRRTQSFCLGKKP